MIKTTVEYSPFGAQPYMGDSTFRSPKISRVTRWLLGVAWCFFLSPGKALLCAPTDHYASVTLPGNLRPEELGAINTAKHHALGFNMPPQQPRFVLSRSAALAIQTRSTISAVISPFGTARTNDSSTSPPYVACMDSSGVLTFCPLTSAMIPQLSYSSLSGLPTIPTAVASLTRVPSDYQSVYDAYGAAATALSGAQAYSANASNLQSGTVNATLLPTASKSNPGIVRCDGVTVTCASGILSSVGSSVTLPTSGIVNATSPTTSTAATSAQIAAALNTGPTTQLSPALIPNLNQNTTGTAANAVQVNGATLPTSAPCVGTNASQQLVIGTCSGAVSGTPLGKNVTTDFGVNNLSLNGVTDNSAKLQAIVNSISTNGSPQLNFPCGTYYFSTSVLMTGNLVTLLGEGTSGHNGNGCVNVQSDQPIDSIWELATVNQSGGANLNGPRIEHFNFQDTSSGGTQVRSGLKITDMNNIIINDVDFQGFRGDNYSTGSITLKNGSSAVTCTGCSWTASMVPGIIQYNGYPYEVVGFNSPTSITLAVNWPLGTVTSPSAGYSLHYKGIGLWLYPGYSSTASAYDFTQYGTVDNIKASQTWNPMFLSAGRADALNSHEGTSRVSFNSGYINCGLQDSIGIWMGVYTDTTHYHVSENNCSFGVVIAGGHSNDVMASKFENSGASATVLSDGVSTCATGSPNNNTGIPCTKGVLIMGVSATTGSTAVAQNSNNEVAFNYFAQYGNDVEVFAGSYPPQKTQVMGNQHISTATSAVLDGGNNSQILDSGMIQLFNNVTQQTGNGSPALPCGNGTANHVGSTFYNTNGGIGTTEYICRGTGWVGIE